MQSRGVQNSLVVRSSRLLRQPESAVARLNFCQESNPQIKSLTSDTSDLTATMTNLRLLALTLAGLVLTSETFGFVTVSPVARSCAQKDVDSRLFAADDDKFSFGQRIESIKCVVVGALSGGVALAPFSAFHDILLGGDVVRNGVAQWEFDTDMGSLEAALFAIVYRYCVRTDTNPMLNQGVIGAFVLTRTLSRIQVPAYCSAAPLTCR